MVSHYNLIFLGIKCDSGFSLTFPIMKLVRSMKHSANIEWKQCSNSKEGTCSEDACYCRTVHRVTCFPYLLLRSSIRYSKLYILIQALVIHFTFPLPTYSFCLNWTCLKSNAVVRSKTNLDCGLFARFPKLYFVRASNVQITRDYFIKWIKSYFLKEHKLVYTSNGAMMEGGRLFLKLRWLKHVLQGKV